jgi:hypothetical protein
MKKYSARGSVLLTPSPVHAKPPAFNLGAWSQACHSRAAEHSKSFSLIDCTSVWCGRNATKLGADAKAGRSMAEKRIDGRHREGAHLRGVCRGQTRGSETCAEGALSRISSPNRRSSDGERSGAFPLRLLRRSRSWSRSRDSRRPPSGANSWKLGSLRRSSPWSGFSEGILSLRA